MGRHRKDLIKDLGKIIDRRYEILKKIESKIDEVSSDINITPESFMDSKTLKDSVIKDLIKQYSVSYRKIKKLSPNIDSTKSNAGLIVKNDRNFNMTNFLSNPSSILKLSLDRNKKRSKIAAHKIELQDIRAKLQLINQEDINTIIVKLSIIYLHDDLIAYIDAWQNDLRKADNTIDKKLYEYNMETGFALKNEFLIIRDPQEIKFMLANYIHDENPSLKSLFDTLSKGLANQSKIIDTLNLEVNALKNDDGVVDFLDPRVTMKQVKNKAQVNDANETMRYQK